MLISGAIKQEKLEIKIDVEDFRYPIKVYFPDFTLHFTRTEFEELISKGQASLQELDLLEKS